MIQTKLSLNNVLKMYVVSLFNTIPRTKHSHGHKRFQHPENDILHLNDLKKNIKISR
jgi:hypothetical protein